MLNWRLHRCLDHLFRWLKSWLLSNLCQIKLNIFFFQRFDLLLFLLILLFHDHRWFIIEHKVIIGKKFFHFLIRFQAFDKVRVGFRPPNFEKGMLQGVVVSLDFAKFTEIEIRTDIALVSRPFYRASATFHARDALVNITLHQDFFFNSCLNLFLNNLDHLHIVIFIIIIDCNCRLNDGLHHWYIFLRLNLWYICNYKWWLLTNIRIHLLDSDNLNDTLVLNFLIPIVVLFKSHNLCGFAFLSQLVCVNRRHLLLKQHFLVFLLPITLMKNDGRRLFILLLAICFLHDLWSSLVRLAREFPYELVTFIDFTLLQGVVDAIVISQNHHRFLLLKDALL